MDDERVAGGRMGRYRRRSTEGRRSHKVKIALNDQEWARLNSLAAASGVSAPMLCLRAVFAGDVLRAGELAHLRSDLSIAQRVLVGVARNLNQLAKAANSGDAVEVAQVLAYAEAIERQARRVLEVVEAIPSDGVIA